MIGEWYTLLYHSLVPTFCKVSIKIGRSINHFLASYYYLAWISSFFPEIVTEFIKISMHGEPEVIHAPLIVAHIISEKLQRTSVVVPIWIWSKTTLTPLIMVSLCRGTSSSSLSGDSTCVSQHNHGAKFRTGTAVDGRETKL